MKSEAWKLRRMITILSAAAKRPHTPRSKHFKKLLVATGLAAFTEGYSAVFTTT